MIKHTDKSNLMKKGFILAYGYREMKSIMVGNAGHGSRSRKMTDHILSIHRKQREKTGNRAKA